MYPDITPMLIILCICLYMNLFQVSIRDKNAVGDRLLDIADFLNQPPSSSGAAGIH
jgi:hypothetical protein